MSRLVKAAALLVKRSGYYPQEFQTQPWRAGGRVDGVRAARSVVMVSQLAVAAFVGSV